MARRPPAGIGFSADGPGLELAFRPRARQRAERNGVGQAKNAVLEKGCENHSPSLAAVLLRIRRPALGQNSELLRTEARTFKRVSREANLVSVNLLNSFHFCFLWGASEVYQARQNPGISLQAPPSHLPQRVTREHVGDFLHRADFFLFSLGPWAPG